ncbi:MAG: response regulator, partial [Ruminiclostridium sp.]|nr:response regulator [Ruminiclostridium sp.]
VGEGLSELLGLSDFPSGEATVSFEEFRERIGQVDHENRLFGLKVFSESERDEDGSPKGETKETAERIELSRVDPETGETVWLEFRVNRDGSQIVGLVQDITGVVAEKKRIAQGKDDEYTDKLIKANAALRDAYAVAKRANHAKTDFLSRMSHDIRTPMNAIIGMTAIAQMRLDDKERLADCLGKIESSSRYLLSLINEVLDMSKIESGKFVLNEEEFKISELVAAVVEMIRPVMNAKKHEFHTNAAEIGHGCVIGDHVRIRQALVNILSNAAKYTSEGGRIEFTVTEKPTPENGVGCYEFIVRDNGIGMTQEFLDRLYEPFERASDVRVNKEQGTGLGMPITKNIIEMMNGEIAVESEPGKGTVFTVTIRLKLWEEAAPVSEEKSASASLGTFRESNFSGIRALLVDDNALNLEIAEEILKMTGLEIETACDGKEAFERFSASPEGYYKIVFMDIQMPEMNGYEATAAIRSLNRGDAKTVPIVAMTANAFAEDVRAAKDAGMDEHIAKPLDFERLKEVLNARLGG